MVLTPTVNIVDGIDSNTHHNNMCLRKLIIYESTLQYCYCLNIFPQLFLLTSFLNYRLQPIGQGV